MIRYVIQFLGSSGKCFFFLIKTTFCIQQANLILWFLVPGIKWEIFRINMSIFFGRCGCGHVLPFKSQAYGLLITNESRQRRIRSKATLFFNCLYKKATITYAINFRRRTFQAGLDVLVFWLLIKAQKIIKLSVADGGALFVFFIGSKHPQKITSKYFLYIFFAISSFHQLVRNLWEIFYPV